MEFFSKTEDPTSDILLAGRGGGARLGELGMRLRVRYKRIRQHSCKI